ncbi:MAG: hypothetical protein DHS20C18_10820 [Saprospiraceae bacterium]|nr:MAG: hypothetical protein DHS20C18_10820 [Saprospiraceae bacterium]
MPQDRSILNLIYSLNESEKRYFSLFVQMHKNKKDYFELYKKLNKHTGNREKTTERIPSKIKGISNLSRAKKQLYEQLMRSLRLKYEREFKETELNNAICEAFLLKKKGLARQSEERFAQIKKEAMHYECHYQVCTIIDKQLRLAMNNLKKGMMESMLSLHEEKERVLQQIIEEERFEKMRHQAFLLFRSDSDIRRATIAGEVETLIEILLKTGHTANTFFSQNACFDALALLYRLKLDHTEALRYYRKILSLWNKEEHHHFREAFADFYKLHIYNYLNTLHLTAQYEEFDQRLKEARKLKLSFLEDEVEDFQNIEFLKFLQLINTNKFVEAQQLIPEIETRLLSYSDRVECMIESRKITWLYNIAVFYFIIEEFDSAETWFLRLFSLSFSKEQRKDLKYLSKIFLLIIHYEKGYPRDEERLQKSTLKYLKRNEAYLDFEKIVLHELNALSSYPTDLKRKKATLVSFQQKIEEIKRAKSIRNGVEEIGLWIQSRLDGVPIQSII